jgi:hypothetical protein
MTYAVDDGEAPEYQQPTVSAGSESEYMKGLRREREREREQQERRRRQQQRGMRTISA